MAQVNVVGGDSAQLNINVRPTDLAAFGVGIDQVVNAVRAQNLAAPVGQVNSALEQRSIRLEGRFDRPEEFTQLVIAQRGGQLDHARPGRERRGGRGRADVGGVVQRSSGDRSRHREVARVQHDGGGRSA